MRFVLVFLCGLIVMLASSPSHADVQLSDFFVDLSEDSRVNAIYAANQGDETLYLKITATEVIDPASTEPTIRDVKNPRELGLLVSPQRLVIQPGDEGRIRLVALAEPQEDRFYKIAVEPVTGALETDGQVGVKIMVGYSAWAFIRPKGAEPIVSATRDGRMLTVMNSGATLARMTAGKQCAGVICEQIDTFRVLAGQEKTIELPHADRPASFKVRWGGASEDVTY